MDSETKEKLSNIIDRIAYLPWWVIIVAVVGVGVAYSVLTSRAYREAIHFVLDRPQTTTEDYFNVVERMKDGTNVIGVVTDETADTLTVRTVDEETTTFARSRILSESEVTVPCPDDAAPDCEPKTRTRYSLEGLVISGELSLENARSVNVVDSEDVRHEIRKDELAREVRDPEGCEVQDPGACMITVYMPDEQVTGSPIEERSDERTITLRTVDAEFVTVDKADVEEERRREPATCAFNNLQACDEGIFLTAYVTIIAFALSLLLGMIGGLMRVQRNPIIYAVSTLYVEIIRGVPMLVILMYAGFVISPFLRDSFGIELTDLQEAVLGLAFGYGAYLSEVFRAGIQSIHRGQMEAARSLGMSYPQAMRYVVLPQAIRVILPPLGNDFISMLKDSALISVLALPDLLQLGRLYVSRTFNAFVGYNTVALLYLVMTLFLSLLVRVIESKTRLPE